MPTPALSTDTRSSRDDRSLSQRPARAELRMSYLSLPYRFLVSVISWPEEEWEEDAEWDAAVDEEWEADLPLAQEGIASAPRADTRCLIKWARRAIT